MKTTIELACEAGHMVIDDYYTNGPVRAFSPEQLKAFEALVRADERARLQPKIIKSREDEYCKGDERYYFNE